MLIEFPINVLIVRVPYIQRTMPLKEKLYDFCREQRFLHLQILCSRMLYVYISLNVSGKVTLNKMWYNTIITTCIEMEMGKGKRKFLVTNYTISYLYRWFPSGC